MDNPGQIKAKREAAAQARRLSVAFTSEEDRTRVLAFAAELEAQADDLERELTVPTPPQVTHSQMQVQQGAEQPPPKPKKP